MRSLQLMSGRSVFVDELCFWRWWLTPTVLLWTFFLPLEILCLTAKLMQIVAWRTLFQFDVTTHGWFFRTVEGHQELFITLCCNERCGDAHRGDIILCQFSPNSNFQGFLRVHVLQLGGIPSFFTLLEVDAQIGWLASKRKNFAETAWLQSSIQRYLQKSLSGLDSFRTVCVWVAILVDRVPQALDKKGNPPSRIGVGSCGSDLADLQCPHSADNLRSDPVQQS